MGTQAWGKTTIAKAFWNANMIMNEVRPELVI